MGAVEVQPAVEELGGTGGLAWETGESDVAPHRIETTRGSGRLKFHIFNRISVGNLG